MGLKAGHTTQRPVQKYSYVGKVPDEEMISPLKSVKYQHENLCITLDFSSIPM